jgi:hypothetical protein
MKTTPDLKQKMEEALGCLDGIQRAEPRPFFYTRVMARLERQNRTMWESIGSFLARPVVAIAGLCVIVVLNVVALTRDESSLASSTETLMTDNEYILASSSSFDYENIDQ